MQDLLVALFVIALVIGLILLVCCAVRWACEDAASRGASKLLAAVLVVFAFPLGLWLWLLIRPPLRAPLLPRLHRISSGRLPPPPASPAAAMAGQSRPPHRKVSIGPDHRSGL